MLILFKSFLGILLLDHRFFFHYIVAQVCASIWHWKFQSIAFEQEILWKRWFALAFRKHFFFCYAIFTWVWTCKTHDLTDYQLTVGSFLPSITFMWSNRQIPGWPQFFQQQFFHSVPSLVDFNCAIIFQSFHFDFLCANLGYPIISYRLFSNLQSAVVFKWSILEIGRSRRDSPPTLGLAMTALPRLAPAAQSGLAAAGLGGIGSSL